MENKLYERTKRKYGGTNILIKEHVACIEAWTYKYEWAVEELNYVL
jgi:hypothetical protein